MKVEVTGIGSFQTLRVELNPGEEFISEAGKLVRMSGHVQTEVTTKPKGSGGGFFAGLKRLVGGDSFFMQWYRVHGGGPGEVVLAPTMVGGIQVIELDGSKKWLCSGGSYMASAPTVNTEPQFQGAKGFLTGESLFFLECSGTGPVVVNAFGAIREVDVDGSFIVDTGHVVAFETSLTFEITKAGSSWWQSFLSGEGFVMKFNGKGKMYLQSHNPNAFGEIVGAMLPPRD